MSKLAAVTSQAVAWSHGATERRRDLCFLIFWYSRAVLCGARHRQPGSTSTQHLVNVISSPVNTMPRYSFPTTNLSISFLWTHVFRFIYLGFLTKNLKKKTWCKASYLLSHLKPKRLLHVRDALGDKVTGGGRWPGRWCSVVSYDGGPLLMSHWILSWLIWPHSTYSATIPGQAGVQEKLGRKEGCKIWPEYFKIQRSHHSIYVTADKGKGYPIYRCLSLCCLCC